MPPTDAASSTTAARTWRSEATRPNTSSTMIDSTVMEPSEVTSVAAVVSHAGPIGMPG